MNEKKTYKVNALKVFAVFLCIMGIMTFVSRAIYSNRIAKVSLVSIANKPLSYKINCSGTLETSKELAICVIPDLRIEEVCVRKGDTVKKGDILIRYDKEYLESNVEKLENEIETDKLTRSDYYNMQAWNSAKIVNISIEEKQKRLDKYTELLENGRKVQSKINGVITDVCIKSGDISHETAAFHIADKSANLFFAANITKSDTELLSVGDLLSISFRNGKECIDNCEITSINTTDSDEIFRLETSIESSDLNIGEIGKIEINIITEERYDCIPIEAVHSGGLKNTSML